jgi:xanthine dehydrogenase YagS FAD-binding subunit
VAGEGGGRALRRKTLDDQAIAAAADAAFANARGREHNAFKIELGKRTLARALRQAAALQI